MAKRVILNQPYRDTRSGEVMNLNEVHLKQYFFSNENNSVFVDEKEFEEYFVHYSDYPQHETVGKGSIDEVR